jgi:Ecdysteroid kinase-like family
VRDLSSLTPVFWEMVFGHGVSAGEPQRIGEGMIGANYRVPIVSRNGDVPSSVVVKLPSPGEASRAAGVAHRTYEREAKFYMQLAGTVDVRRPRCHFVEFDDETHDFVLVLEDLGPAVPGNQITGCSDDEAHRAVVELAALHGPRWDDPTLFDVDWLQRRTARADGEMLQAAYQHLLTPFLATYAKYLSDSQIGLARAFGGRLADWIDGRGSVLTLGHGDYRLDNLMFGTPTGGPRIAVVDWQTPNHGPGVVDVSYFLGAAVLPDVRRSIENGLVDDYIAALGRYGIDSNRTTMWRDYVHASFAGLVMAVVASMVVTPTERGEAMFAAMATRAAQHALDLDALDLL